MKTLKLRNDKKKLEKLFIEAINHKGREKIARIYSRGKINLVLKKIGIKIECKPPLNFNAFCRFCKGKSLNNTTITKSYWWSLWSICCKDCKQEGEKEESYECQKIDSDCNDCGYFKRIKGLEGNCKKFNKSVTARPNFCSSYDCFVHRKDLNL